MLLALLAEVPGLVAGEERVSRIDVVGAQSVERDSILSRIELKPGSPYDAAAADRAILALYATGFFSDVRLQQRGGVVTVTVVETPVIGSVTVQGNAEVEKSKLEAVLTLKPRNRYSAAKAKAEAQRLRDYYRSLGRLTTTVEPKVTLEANGQMAVVFVIAEGPVTKIEAITFPGAKAFSTLELKNVVTTSESGIFDFLKTAAFFDAERLKLDRDLLQRHYLKNGFPDAHVKEAEVTKNDAGTGYRIAFAVDEGPRYQM